MKSGVAISIREKSTRFPGKVLKMIENQTVTEHLIDRMKMVKNADICVIATSDDPRDSIFKSFADTKNIKVFFGHPEDKLARYLQVALQYNLDSIVVVDGDDLLCFPEIVEETINLLNSTANDVVFWQQLPLGAACSGLKTSALFKVMQIKDEVDTEVWGGYFTDAFFSVNRVKWQDELFNHPEIRLTLDYEEDYRLFREIFSRLSVSGGNTFSSSAVMQLLVHLEPELLKINSSVQALYEQNLKKSAPVKLRSTAK